MTSLFGGGAKAVSKTPTRAMGIDLQGSQYGPPIPVVFGQNKVAGNVIWYGDFKATSHTQKQPGKGGGGSSSTSYTYSSSFQLGLCEGVASVVNVYQGSSTVSLSRSGGIAFSGSTGQAAWSHLTGSAALGYSGTALVAFQNLELGSSASLPNFNFEVAARNQFGGGIVDANPADIVTAICTDSQIGIGFTALGDLTALKNYCTAAGIFFSPVYSTQNPTQQSLSDLFKYANAAPYFSEGKLKVVPYGDATITGNGVTYTPDLTAVADLTRDDFITNGPGDPVTIHRVAPADAMNLVRVEYKDRAMTYHTGAVVASIDQDVVGTGARAEQSESVDMITQAAVARLVAQNLLQRIYYIRNAYQFQLSWRYCYLEPMDIVTLTDANTGLYLTPVRITEIGEDEHGLLSVTAEEFPEGVSHGGTYGTQPNSGATVDPNADPGPIDAPYLFRGPGFLVSNAQPEIWCAITGNSALWAGCDVYISHDGTSYSYLATTSKSAAYGHLTNTLASAADPDTTGAPNVVLNGAAQLLGGSMADADQFITLAMIDSELIAYQTSTLASGPSYTLGYLRRAGYGSANTSHAVNAPFVRLDDNILRIPVDPSQIGQTVYLKFVSFNVFGRGGRTLADETAYTYVIGTNSELPDVPVTPAGPVVTAVADGAAITWTNSNPAAVGCTSIEYATASTGPWTVLAQVGPTTTAYAHHFTNGATYFYRLRSRGPLVSGGWSAYTSTLSTTGKTVQNGATNGATIGPGGNVTGAVDPNGRALIDFSQGGHNYKLLDYIDDGPAYSRVKTAQIGNGIVKVPGSGRNCVLNPTFRYNTVGTANGGSVQNGPLSDNWSAFSGDSYSYGVWYNGTVRSRAVAGKPLNGSTTNGGVTYNCDISSDTFSVSPNSAYKFNVGRDWGWNAVALPAGVSAFHRVYVEFFDYNGNHLSYDNVQDVVWNTASGMYRYSGTVPSNAFSAQVVCYLYFTNSSAATTLPANSYFDSILTFVEFTQAAHMDYDVVDGSSYARPLASRINAGRPVIDFSEPIHSNKTLDYIGDSGSFRRVSAGYVDGSNRPLSHYIPDTRSDNQLPSWYRANYPNRTIVEFKVASAIGVPTTAGYVNLKTVVQWNDTTGGVITQTVEASDRLWVRRGAANDASWGAWSDASNLTIAGSGVVLGNQLNAPNSLTLGYGVVRNTTALTASSTGAVSVNAYTNYMGGHSVAYSAVSNAVTGLTVGSTYTIWCHDPGGVGGTKTWYASSSQQIAMQQGDDVVIAGDVTIPSSGTSGGGGVVACVCDCMYIAEERAAGESRPGDVFDCLDIPTQGMRKFRRRLQSVEYSTVPCVRITTDAGAILECSLTTPFDVPDGRTVLAPDMLGEQVVTDKGIETVAQVADIGERRVCHNHLGGVSYAAGADPAHRIYSHNAAKP